MRILNEKDVEIQEEDVDTTKGYLKPDKVFKEHVAHQDAKPEIKHYEVTTFYFEDGTKLDVENNEDPHVKVIDDQAGIFDYINSDGEEKQMRGADIKSVVDQEETKEVEEHDEYEDIQRYVLYTEKELAEQKKQQEDAEKQQDFLVNGPDKLDANTSSIEDLTVMISEMVGAE